MGIDIDRVIDDWTIEWRAVASSKADIIGAKNCFKYLKSVWNVILNVGHQVDRLSTDERVHWYIFTQDFLWLFKVESRNERKERKYGIMKGTHHEVGRFFLFLNFKSQSGGHHLQGREWSRHRSHFDNGYIRKGHLQQLATLFLTSLNASRVRSVVSAFSGHIFTWKLVEALGSTERSTQRYYANKGKLILLKDEKIDVKFRNVWKSHFFGPGKLASTFWLFENEIVC